MNKLNHHAALLSKLDIGIHYAILAMVFFLALSPFLTTVFLILGAAMWILKLLLTRGRIFRRTPFDLPILCFALLAASSVLVSPDKGFSFYNYYNLMGRYILLYYLVVQNIIAMKQLRQMIGAMLLAALWVVGYGFYQYVYGIDVTNMLWIDGDQFPQLKTRVFSTLENPNILAGYLTVMMSMVFGALCKIKARCYQYVLMLFFLLMGACLMMTYSRGAWISLFMVIAGYSVVKNRKVLLGLIVFGAVLLFFDTSIAQRLLSSFDASDTSSSMRVAIWESTIAMIVEHPLLGIGWGSYWMVYPAYDFFIQNAAVKIVHAHNMYLNFAAETGIAGLLSFLACMFGHLRLAMSNTHLHQSNLLNGLTLGSGLAISVMAVNGFTDYVLFNIELSMLFWLISAMVVLTTRRNLDE